MGENVLKGVIVTAPASNLQSARFAKYRRRIVRVVCSVDNKYVIMYQTMFGTKAKVVLPSQLDPVKLMFDTDQGLYPVSEYYAVMYDMHRLIGQHARLTIKPARIPLNVGTKFEHNHMMVEVYYNFHPMYVLREVSGKGSLFVSHRNTIADNHTITVATPI